MSMKRTSAESNNDQQTNKDSDSVFRQEDSVKRAKLTSWSDTTVQDLPNEVLHCILVKAVVMEVKGMKLIKRVWKEKADLVISRLRTVCSRWSDIVTTDLFRKEVHRALDGSAQETIRLETLHQSQLHFKVYEVTTMKDEIFMLCNQYYQDNIVVYDRNNMADVKAVIALPGKRPVNIAGCSASNCVYVLNKELHCHSVLRITKDEEHQFNISPWINDLSLPNTTCSISVSSNGSIVILSSEFFSMEILSGDRRPIPALVRIHNANGSLQHEIILSQDIFSMRYVFNVNQKSNGNLVLASICCLFRPLLTEIDATGRILRQYQTTLFGDSGVSFADIYGRILVTDMGSTTELLDSELNPLDFTGKQPYEGECAFPSKLHYNSERNEIVRICDLVATQTKVLTIFRFIEE